MSNTGKFNRDKTLTSDRLHSKKVVLSAKHSCGTEGSLVRRHSLGVFLCWKVK